MSITQSITPMPEAPSPTDTQAEFDTKSFAHVAAQAGLVTEVNTWAGQANALAADVAASAAAAATSADAAAAAANFVGEWSALSGPLNKPATVRHTGNFWVLLVNLADVTLSEPGVSADWASASDEVLINRTLLTPTITGTRETHVAMGANDINLASGNFFTKTISGAATLTVSNVPASGTTASFILDLTNGGSAAVTWWSGVKWAGGTAPTLTAAGRDVLGFFTHDAGTTWTGLMLGKDVK